eukprot:TRINITY_DN544_c0_g1_i7.p1 TRINITY_DN544_c0_g1~~TRINITY_DN544_c0_g1_i7.p1  ORF type:complete len:197 (-),score=24.34 TRINITY_DN544_c0_g1_i7:729-1319(-)
MEVNRPIKPVDVQELRKHNTRESLWMAIDGNVYDFTSLVENHPGGEDILMEFAGQDGSDCFERAAHTPYAHKVLSVYLLGPLQKNADKTQLSQAKKDGFQASKGMGPLMSRMNLRKDDSGFDDAISPSLPRRSIIRSSTPEKPRSSPKQVILGQRDVSVYQVTSGNNPSTKKQSPKYSPLVKRNSPAQASNHMSVI